VGVLSRSPNLACRDAVLQRKAAPLEKQELRWNPVGCPQICRTSEPNELDNRFFNPIEIRLRNCQGVPDCSWRFLGFVFDTIRVSRIVSPKNAIPHVAGFLVSSQWGISRHSVVRHAFGLMLCFHSHDES